MKNGLGILLSTYWSSKGWKDGTISKEDFQVAKEQGYMFDYPKYETHEDTLKKVNGLLEKINPVDVANAFLYSLSTRKLEYRSILGSYYYAKAVPMHELAEKQSKHCYLCGWYAWNKEPKEFDLKLGCNVFNFERYKFGGVRHTHIDYALFDMEQFLKLPKVIPTDTDKIILSRILECVNKLEKKEKVGKLRDLIVKEKIFKSNKNEVGVILNILGICGILSSAECPCYEDEFVDEYGRSPIEYKNDFSYPVNRWRAEDGINYTKFEKVFNYKI